MGNYAEQGRQAVQRGARRAAKLARLLPNPTFRRGLRFGVGAAIEHRTALGPLRFQFVVDIGAHAGQFSLLTRALNPGARIIAFEPLPRAADRYRRVFANDGGATLVESAIAPRRGSALMHLSAAPDSSSLLPIAPRQVARFPGTGEVGSMRVAIGFLGDFLNRADIAAPALLKIDVQGFELEVLRAAAPLLDAFGHVYVEASFEELYAGQALAPDVSAFLAGHGFAEAGRFNLFRARDGTPVQADFLFHRPPATGGSANSASSAVRPNAAAADAVPTGSARQAARTTRGVKRLPAVQRRSGGGGEQPALVGTARKGHCESGRDLFGRARLRHSHDQQARPAIGVDRRQRQTFKERPLGQGALLRTLLRHRLRQHQVRQAQLLCGLCRLPPSERGIP